MKYHTATIKHDPPNTYGDCLRTSVACILDIDRVEHVPHFYEDGCDGETGIQRLRDWARSIGFSPWFNSFSGEHSRKEVLEFVAAQNPDVNYLLFGCTDSGGDHVVICRNDVVIHNVAWYGSHIVAPTSDGCWFILVFVKYDEN